MPPCVQKTINALFGVRARDRDSVAALTRSPKVEPTPSSETLNSRKFRRLIVGRICCLRFGPRSSADQWLNRNSFVARSDQSNEPYASLRSVSESRYLT